jgi:hypothetical protein
MFSRKAQTEKVPTEQKVTTNLADLKAKATQFLHDNLDTVTGTTLNVPTTCYMLEPRSINYIKKITLTRFRKTEDDTFEEDKRGDFAKIVYSYTGKDNNPQVKSIKTITTPNYQTKSVETTESDGKPVRVKDKGVIILNQALNTTGVLANPIWYDSSMFYSNKKNIANAVLGGKRKTKRKRKTRSNR